MTRSGSKVTDGIAEDLEPQDQQDDHHDRRVVVGHELTNGSERSLRPTRPAITSSFTPMATVSLLTPVATWPSGSLTTAAQPD